MERDSWSINKRLSAGMVSCLLAGVAALIYFLAIFSPVAEASIPSQAPSGDFRPGSILVKYKPLVFPFVADAVLSVQGYRTLRTLGGIGIRQLEVTPGRETQAIMDLQKNPLIEYAELDVVRRPLFTPDDTYYPSAQWNLRKINMPEAWDISQGENSVKVAVIDTGFNSSHPDRAKNIVSPYNECAANNNPTDEDGHGTHVSGILAADTDNDRGLAGVAPGISLMPIKVECLINGEPVIYVSNEIAAIQRAADNGAKVINLSLGGPESHNGERDAVNYAKGKGVFVVAAAGNEGPETTSYPGAYPGVMAVGATATDDTLASYSSYTTVNPFVSVAAPGGTGSTATNWIISTYLTTTYAYMKGTSMAAPHVSGLAGLIWSVNPALSNLQVAHIITSTAADLGTPGKDGQFGWGRINALAALTTAQQTLPASTSTPTRTATATATVIAATATATATATAASTATPTATATKAPTAIPAATAIPSPTSTQIPRPGPVSLAGQSYLPNLVIRNQAW